MKRFLWFFIGAMLWYSTVLTSGCAKNRLFTHVDSIPEVPSQFHYFNSFAYDSTLNFSVDGLLRENVKQFAFSSYYPSSSAFNLNEAQPNSKLVNTNDPANPSLFASMATFQFEPLTSYLVYYDYSAYDTLYTPEKTIVPTLEYYPEDVNHPFDGTTRIRLFDMTAGSTVQNLTVSPNVGAGTTLTLNPIFLYGAPPTDPATTYTGTEPGAKLIKLTVNSNGTVIQFAYLATPLQGSVNYSFFAVGDPKNYLAGIQPRPRLFMVEDGNPASLTELTVSSVSYPGNLTTTSQVTVVNGAYNVPGLLTYGTFQSTDFVQYPYLNVTFNQSILTVLRWPLTPTAPQSESIGDAFDPDFPYPSLLIGTPGRIATSILQPGLYTAAVTPAGTFAPQYASFNATFEQGTGYTVCLVPNDTTAKQCGTLIVPNDNMPDPAHFRLRIINIMGGTTQVDVHQGSPSGPLVAGDIPYDQPTDYINLPPTTVNQNLYVTAAGSTTPLFPQGGASLVISCPFTAGNSATIFLMGLLPGTPYSGDSGYFGPYVLYNTEAYIKPSNVYSSGRPVQLYY